MSTVTPNRRRRVAASLHIVAGTFVIGIVGTLWVCAAMLAPIFEGSFVPELLAMVGRPVAATVIAFGALEVVAAIAVLRGREWGRLTLIAVALPQLALFPIGTALAVYTGWALMPAASRFTRTPP